MYTGQSQRGLGCMDCANRPTATGLGIAPAVAALVVQQAPQILQSIDKLFGDTGSLSTTQARVRQWVQLILADPAGAVSGIYTPGNNSLASAANAYLWLNCAAGNQQVLNAYRQASGDPAVGGCGFETLYGGRADAQAALAQVDQALNQPTPVESNAPQPSQPSYGGGSQMYGSNSGTIYGALPGGGGVNIPVPASSLFNATLFGLPVSVLALGAVVFAFAGGHKHGRRN